MRQAPAPPLESLPGVGPKTAASLRKAGLTSSRDLLFHLPTEYEDRRNPRTLGTLEPGGRYALIGRLEGLRQIRLPGRRVLIQGRLEDDTGSLSVRWLNRPFLLRQVKERDAVVLYGEVTAAGDGRSMTNPSLEKVDRLAGSELLLPVYRSLGGLGPSKVRKVLAALLQGVVEGESPPWLAEPFPTELLRRHSLPALKDAFSRVHRPVGEDSVAALRGFKTPAHHRLIYGEVLELMLTGRRLRQLRGSERKGRRYGPGEAPFEAAREILPFEATGAQRRVFEEIAGDLSRPQPMRRLLQGDVGSGKTAVAAQALAVALESGYDAVYMAPTQLLAEQHFLTFQGLLAPRFPIRLEMAGVSSPPVDTEGGTLFVGTHALLEDSTTFRDLALVVIDEQHRFGVGQRERLVGKGDQPDLLVLSATPIPRSLTLTHYGDLDLSVLDELPPGRGSVTTELIPRRRRRSVWKRLQEEVEAGGQAFVVFPAIDGGREDLSLNHAGAALLEALPPGSAALIHGRLDPRRRAEIMDAFREGSLRVLLATTVVEVGIDVADATLMILEGAETFGLAQLHQLRGRVGRGRRASFCWAIHGKLSPLAQRRLEAFVQTQDGFRLAEEDLALRGAGDLYGSQGRRQAGPGTFRIADPVRDRLWWSRAQQDAAGLDSLLGNGRHALLRDRIEVLARIRFGAGGGG